MEVWIHPTTVMALSASKHMISYSDSESMRDFKGQWMWISRILHKFTIYFIRWGSQLHWVFDWDLSLIWNTANDAKHKSLPLKSAKFPHRQNHNSTYSRVTVENRQHNRPKFAIFSITQPDTSRNTLNTIQSTSSHENMFKNWPDFCCLGVGLADDLTGVFVAVVDLPVDFSAGFLPLSGCFLSSALALVLSAASPAWEYEKSNSEEHCYLKPFQNVLTAI